MSKKKDIKNLSIEHVAFCERGSAPTQNAVSVNIPDSLAGEIVSHCGVKGFMIDEIVKFTKKNGENAEIVCAHVACLEITDSPVHKHFKTTETYIVLKGQGKMLLDDEVIDVSEGSVVVIPPEIRHGLHSTTDEPVKVLMTFSPGLAPKEHEDYRDEQSLLTTATEEIAKLKK